MKRFTSFLRTPAVMGSLVLMLSLVGCTTIPDEVSAQLASNEETIAQLNDQLDSLQTQLDEAQAANGSASTEAQEQISQLEQQISTLQMGLDEAQAIATSFAQYFPEGPDQAGATLDQLDSYIERAENATDQNRQLQGQLDQLRSEAAREVSMLENRISQLEAVLEDLTQMGMLTVQQIKEQEAANEAEPILPPEQEAVQINASLYNYTLVEDTLPLIRSDRTGRQYIREDNLFYENSPRERTRYYYDTRSNYSMAPAVYLEIRQAGTNDPELSLYLQANGSGQALGIESVVWENDAGSTLTLPAPTAIERERDQNSYLDRIEYPLNRTIIRLINEMMVSERGILLFTGTGGSLQYPVSRQEREALLNVLRIYQDLGGEL